MTIDTFGGGTRDSIRKVNVPWCSDGAGMSGGSVHYRKVTAQSSAFAIVAAVDSFSQQAQRCGHGLGTIWVAREIKLRSTCCGRVILTSETFRADRLTVSVISV